MDGDTVMLGSAAAIACMRTAERQQVMGACIHFVDREQPLTGFFRRGELAAMGKERRFEQQRVAVAFGFEGGGADVSSASVKRS